jgi:hypothetical protein
MKNESNNDDNLTHVVELYHNKLFLVSVGFIYNY